MATEFGTGMREETVRELERVRREVLMAKQELRDRFEYYFRVLRVKHLEMEARLDEVVRVAETQVMDTQTQLNQLRTTKAEVSQNLIHNKLNQTLEKVSRDLEEEIKRVEAVVDKVPTVWLEWRDEWLEGGMRESCRVCEGVSYVHRQTPVWTGVSRGHQRNDELSHPWGLVTDRDNGEVFVCDYSGRIQVYDKHANYQRCLRAGGGLYPVSIAITPHQLLVRCEGLYSCNIVKLDKLSSSVMSSATLEGFRGGITADTDTIYGGLHETNQILHLSLEDLSTIKVTSLSSPYINQDTKLQDIRVTTSLFVVLFRSSDKPSIQTFSREGNFVGIIVSEEQLGLPCYFCLDRHFNIIVSNCLAHNIKVFSLEGDLIATIGHEGTGPGEFYKPAGIDVDKDGRIVVVDEKDTNKLQFF